MGCQDIRSLAELKIESDFFCKITKIATKQLIQFANIQPSNGDRYFNQANTGCPKITLYIKYEGTSVNEFIDFI